MLDKEAEQAARYKTAKSAADLRALSAGTAYAPQEKK